ncbi:MAG: TonB-dependent receptor [Cyclobacteriaceae bacterium]|nr:TonB-dependent receptor [Cyclobacteriaceae bacterium]
MKKTLQLTLVLWFAVLAGAAAQDRTVSGKTVAQGGEPLPGVNVLVKGTNNGTTTDATGNFTVGGLSENSVLVFSFIGYKTQEVLVGSRLVLEITLEEDVTALGEVVVIGYGTQQKKDITGAVTVVGKEAMESRPNTQFGNLIQGKTAGVQVLSSSGKPSAGFSMRIRGTSSISGSSEPLYVVDGVISQDTRTINPADIENITVLKDASSAAIYGAQGANGVVLITTKQGSSAKPRFEFGAYTGFASVWKTLRVLNAEQYRDLMTEMGQSTDWSQYTANTDWQNEIFQNGRSQNYQFSVSGKNDKTTYYLSAGWMQQKGAVRSSEMDRYNFKVNLKQYVNDKLAIGTNLNYSRYHDVDVSDNTNVNSGGVILGALTSPANIGIYNEDGTFTRNPFQDWENPVSATDGSDRGYTNQRVLGNVYAELDVIEGLQFKSNLGIDYIMGIYDYFLDPFRTSYGRARQGIARNTTSLTNYYIFDNTLTYRKVAGEHNFSALAGTVIQKTRWENNAIETNGFSGTSVPTTGAGSTILSASNDKAEKSNASFISRVTYDYAGKYLLTANFRADGSSAFGPNKRWGYFPSASVGWRISQESFFPAVDVINDLKIRAGWGMVGNDIGSYAYLGLVGTGANYPIGSEILPGSYPSTIQNNDLKWEATQQTNIGIDVTVLNSRITFSADAYIKKTSDLLLYVPLPKSTGFDTGLQNVGDIENKGLEFVVSSKNLTGALQWDTDFNISFNRNKVINVIGSQITGGAVAGRGDVSLSREGHPLGMFYGYIGGGVDPATGNYYYIRSNGESTFTPSADTDRTFIGNPNPNFIFGLTNNFSYKNFSLSIFLQGSQGNDIFNATKVEMEGMNDAKSQAHSVINRWRAPGDVTSIPKATPNSAANSQISTRFVEDGSYLRAKAVTLSYNVPSSVLQKANLGTLKLYVTGENLFTITSYSGLDPEVNAFGGSNTVQGVDFGTYPQTRNLIIGLNLTF